MIGRSLVARDMITLSLFQPKIKSQELYTLATSKLAEIRGAIDHSQGDQIAKRQIARRDSNMKIWTQGNGNIKD